MGGKHSNVWWFWWLSVFKIQILNAILHSHDMSVNRTEELVSYLKKKNVKLKKEVVHLFGVVTLQRGTYARMKTERDSIVRALNEQHETAIDAALAHVRKESKTERDVTVKSLTASKNRRIRELEQENALLQLKNTDLQHRLDESSAETNEVVWVSTAEKNARNARINELGLSNAALRRELSERRRNCK